LHLLVVCRSPALLVPAMLLVLCALVLLLLLQTLLDALLFGLTQPAYILRTHKRKGQRTR